MAQQDGREASPARKAGSVGRGKLVFLAIVLAAAALIWMHHRGGPSVASRTSLDEALRIAAAQDRRVLAVFVGQTPGPDARKLIGKTMAVSGNVEAIEAGRFLVAETRLASALDCDTARRFRIRKLPTCLILDSAGKELNRREGFIGEAEFREGFLNCEKIVKPGSQEPRAAQE